jgi:DNA-binding response OmpR family regulator
VVSVQPGNWFESAEPLSKVKILVVDHEQTIVDYLHILLLRYGFEATTETCSTKAIKKAGTLAPKVLIVNPVMPGWSGVDVATSISRKTKCGVLFLGTSTDTSGFRKDLHRLREQGCECRAMALPFEKADLLRKLQLLTLASCR